MPGVSAWWNWSLGFAALHTFYVLAFSLFLIELQFSGYRKIPLGCPRPEFRENLLAMCMIQFFAFFALTRLGASLEQKLSANRCVSSSSPSRWRPHGDGKYSQAAREAGEWEEGFTFDNTLFRAVVKLNISDGL